MFDSSLNLAGSISVFLEAPPHYLLQGQSAVMKIQSITMEPTLSWLNVSTFNLKVLSIKL